MDRYASYIETLSANDAMRVLRDVEHRGADIVHNGRIMKNLSSNDYLGIGSDTGLWEEFLSSYPRGEFGGGACSSRLLTGNHTAYASLEAKLAGMYGAESALIFASGYHANIGILPALTSKKDLIIADKLVHASLIDGMRLSGCDTMRFPHNDTARLEEILAQRRGDYDKVFIVTESIFSMDGDLAPLKKLVEIKKRFSVYLYVDEAHAIGTRSGDGLGLCREEGVAGEVDLLVGTFGKAVASQGAFLISNRILRDYLVNTMRSLIFSTALPPISVRWSEFVMERFSEMEGRREHLAHISEMLRAELLKNGIETAGSSNIVPVITGSNAKAVELSERVCGNGFFVLPIRTPTVPAGSERLRVSLTAAITDEDVKKFAELCVRFGR